MDVPSGDYSFFQLVFIEHLLYTRMAAGTRHAAMNKAVTVPALMRLSIWFLSINVIGLLPFILPLSVFLSSNSWGQIKLALGLYYNWLDPPESSIRVHLWPGYRGWESRDFSEEAQGLMRHPKNHFLLHDLQICHLWFILYPLKHPISKSTLIKKKPFYIMLLWEARAITALIWKEFLPEQLALSVNIADDLGSWDLREHQLLLTYFPDRDTKVRRRGVTW